MSMDKIHKLFSDAENEALMIRNMRAEIEKEKVHQQYKRMIDAKKLRESLVIDPDKEYKDGTVTEKNRKFQAVMKEKLPFINDILSTVTCVAAGVVYLVAAKTGGGKSTAVANIVIPIYNANRKILVISNEESRNHVYVRIACRILGYSFIKWTKGELHESIMDTINNECERLTKIITVIGTDYQDNPKYVTTPEGLEIVFNKFAQDHEVILFDYFQAISHGVENTDPQVWVHQEKFCNFLNVFRNKFDGPIFVMSQLWPAKKKDTSDFLERIKGRKAIGDISMVHIEVSPDKDNYTTDFAIHKDRLWNNDGIRITTGYDRDSGQFVAYTEEFKAKAAKWIADRIALHGGSDELDDDPEDDTQTIESISNTDDTQDTQNTQDLTDDTEDELNLDF